ncbi:MlaA family lipoprotein [Noviluteimonas gilva]|uniref:VacJ family lipoprotein n=1 Tax=Noviluteimonas gilva TaxID=2682097 RepID=A0A7C9LHH9_9GAMM|nr:VacJ family lipoprotein [Lysobacter gilvus]MUV13139.1 VacJ family lipoprotein [Lysobacter gilvus]
MDRPLASKFALLAGALIALSAPVAFAQNAADSALPASETTVVAPVDVAVPSTIAAPVAVEPSPATSVAAPADAPVAVDAAVPSASTSAQPQTTEVPTAAEEDFVSIYGDGALPTPAELPQAYDPWEPFNRRMHTFNNAIDRMIARPLAKAYVKVVPRPVRLGVSNFFSNLYQPLSALNSLLQGKPKQAGQAMGRFALNVTLGLGGIFDPASDAKLPRISEDFGQTLGVWGWKQSRFIELPLFGPRTVRDVFGMAGDAPFGLLRNVEEDKVRIFLQGLQLVDVRTQLLSVDAMREGAADDYALVRDAWLQRRNYQIFGDRNLDDDDTLPEYLRDENNPTVPLDAIPVTPMDGG